MLTDKLFILKKGNAGMYFSFNWLFQKWQRLLLDIMVLYLWEFEAVKKKRLISKGRDQDAN